MEMKQCFHLYPLLWKACGLSLHKAFVGKRSQICKNRCFQQGRIKHQQRQDFSLCQNLPVKDGGGNYRHRFLSVENPMEKLSEPLLVMLHMSACCPTPAPKDSYQLLLTFPFTHSVVKHSLILSSKPGVLF